MYKLGSLFDGSGGFPLAGSLCGIAPAWASEVEPYPIAVTRSRFPGMRHLGDISRINGGAVEPVDVITFGSPCQDLSIAGKRAGLKHEANGDEETTRSGLFMEAVRIIKEMREATNGVYPRIALWENVPGAFSSNKGEDFRIVLEELIKICEPTAVMPAVPAGGWPYADLYCGDGWSLAYRTFDAQYWGVPQRRRRIHLVLDLRGQRAGEISFEREGLRGYFAQGGSPWQAAPGDAGNGAAAADGELTPYTLKIRSGCEGGGKGTLVQTDKSATLATNNDQYLFQPIPTVYDARGNGGRQIVSTLTGDHENRITDYTNVVTQQGCLTPWEAQTRRIHSVCGVYPTLSARATSGQDQQAVLTNYIVRRLTPTECARLQGFPDRWGDIDPKEDFTDEEYAFWLEARAAHATINGKPVKEYTRDQMLTWYNKLHTDSAEYKMWGNGIALPPALYIMQGIKAALEEDKDEP